MLVFYFKQYKYLNIFSESLDMEYQKHLILYLKARVTKFSKLERLRFMKHLFYFLILIFKMLNSGCSTNSSFFKSLHSIPLSLYMHTMYGCIVDFDC